MTDMQKSARSTTGKAAAAFTDEERAAMRERAQEQKAAARRGPRASQWDGDRGGAGALARHAALAGSSRCLRRQHPPVDLSQHLRRHAEIMALR
jgi:hypothetical protein